MEPDTCPDRDASLQQVGVREHGLASFEAHLVWNPEAQLYEMEPGGEPAWNLEPVPRPVQTRVRRPGAQRDTVTAAGRPRE